MFSSMTDREYFLQHGTLSLERIEQLLDQHEAGAAIDTAAVLIKIGEARAQYPEEDFAHSIVSRLQTLTKHVRGANREELQGIIESFEDLLQCQFNSTDYAMSELRDAANILDPRAEHKDSSHIKKYKPRIDHKSQSAKAD